MPRQAQPINFIPPYTKSANPKAYQEERTERVSVQSLLVQVAEHEMLIEQLR